MLAVAKHAEKEAMWPGAQGLRVVDEVGCSDCTGIRFVVAPTNEVVPDLLGKLPGQGLWLRATREQVDTAVRERWFSNLTQTNVVVPPDLANRVERLLAERCVELISLARRAGEAVAGFEKARTWMLSGKAMVLVQALDSTVNALGKIESLSEGLPTARLLLGHELGRVFGRNRVVYVVLAKSILAQKFCNEAQRLVGFRNDGGE